MEFMTAIPKYFENISQDAQYLHLTRSDSKGRNYLIVSLALRILGGFLAFNTLRCIVACFLSPLTLMGSLASAIVAFILARDLLKVGDNMRNTFAPYRTVLMPEEQNKPFFSWDMGEKNQNPPGDFKDTIIAKNAYALWQYGKTLLTAKKAEAPQTSS